MYRVGFGDFFLLTLTTAGTPLHILIDCGVHAGNLGSIGDAVADLAKETNQHLSLVVVTHRHADHISGFATCAKEFADFTVDATWMSWWDDPGSKVAARAQDALSALASQLQLSLSARTDEAGLEAREMAENITGTLGATGGSNAAALDMLRRPGFKHAPTPAYYKAGDTPVLPASLVKAGLSAQILGPPISPDLVSQMSKSSEDYLAALAGSVSDKKIEPFTEQWRVPKVTLPAAALYPFKSVSEIRRQVLANQPEVLEAAAQKADNTINNQSLVILFKIRGKNLLFVGDAQWGNWENFLYGSATPPGAETDILAASKQVLSSLDFYKVGHHGSTNASPIDAVESMRDGLVAMCSTQPGCYGNAKKGTEVPRGPLLDALEKKTRNQLACSDQVTAGKNKANSERPGLAKVFSTTGDLWIDWELAL
jgi:hypothetical protein